MEDPHRNVELKALDPDPEGTLACALALTGVADHGILRQRDTYFAVAEGRLKLREETPGEAHLIAYARPDDPAVRVSAYRLAPAPDPGAMRAALTASLGVRVVVDKARRLLLWHDVRIHLDTVAGLGSFIELEAVAPPESDLSAEHAKVAHLREILGIEDGSLREGSYSDALLPAPDPELLRLAREAVGRAYAPYSGFGVGAAVRTTDGRRYAGTNVENAAFPQGQCAEASALGAMVAGGGGRVAEVVVAAAGAAECAPCGGCRQRLHEFAAGDVPVHLIDLERVRRRTTLGELLPLAFGPETMR